MSHRSRKLDYHRLKDVPPGIGFGVKMPSMKKEQTEAYQQGFRDGVNLLHSRILDNDPHGNSLVKAIADKGLESVLETVEQAKKLNEG